MTSRLPYITAAAVAALRANADLLYRHQDTWSDGTTCRYGAQEPSRVNSALATSLRQQPDALKLRIVHVHPDDERPLKGATVSWQGYTLRIVDWSDTSDFTGGRTGTARLEQ